MRHLDVLEATDFYNPDDTIQKRYEMLRRKYIDGLKIKEAAKKFGYSVPYFKKLKKKFDNKGIEGLKPMKKGPKGRHPKTKKCTQIIISNREKGMNIYENSENLKRKGYNISPTTVHRVLKETGYLKKTPDYEK